MILPTASARELIGDSELEGIRHLTDGSWPRAAGG
jgi:hypothetical protein